MRRYRTHRIYEFDPHVNSFGSYLLMKNDLLSQQKLGVNKYKQLIFNTEFLRAMYYTFGELHCEFCGLQKLKIYEWFQRTKNHSIMATADHWIPRNNNPALRFDIMNMKVSCFDCNNKKGKEILTEEVLLFPYDDKIREKIKLILWEM